VKKLSFVIKYLQYWFSAKTAHGIHSPFVFDLYNEGIHKKGSYYSYEKIEQLRKKLLSSKKEIDVTDLGSGKSGKKIIGKIAAHAAKSAKYGQLLFRLVNYFKPDTILELGTSLGISTSYLASANSNTRVVTIEGCPNIANEARKHFQSLGLLNIENRIGNFDNELSSVIGHQSSVIDFIFFDGNHRKEPTLNYFKQCLEYANNDSVFIFDDIHWSDEMEQAWEEIKKNPKVTVAIDLFFLGLIFFRKEQAKENFIVRF
jgi:predicted O-methyltransferase YrrM